MPQAPSVGDSQLSSSKRMSCCARVDAARLEALEIELLHFVGRRLEDHLELVVLEQAVRVLAEAAVGRPARRLHVGDVPVRGPEHAQERLGVHRAGADLDVERLLQQAAARGPELRELEDEAVEASRIGESPSALASHLAQHPRGLQLLLEMHADQPPMHGLELARRRASSGIASSASRRARRGARRNRSASTDTRPPPGAQRRHSDTSLARRHHRAAVERPPQPRHADERG